VAARSLSWGESFDKPVPVSDKGAPGFRSFASLGVAPNGDVYAVWLDERDNSKPGAETSGVYLARSTDRGATFGRNVLVARQACPCCRPSLAFEGDGTVFVGWRRVFPGEIRDMVISASRDGGRTFAPPVRVHDDGWKLNGCPDSGPALAESHGALFVAWMTAGRDERPRIELARSTDGRSFGQPFQVSGAILDPNHPAMKVADDGTIWLTFQGRAPSANGTWNRSQAYIVHIDSSGTPTPPMAVPGSAASVSYPTLGIGSGGRVFLAWTQPAGDHQVVMLSRGRVQR
jgi:hypothetical protein